MFSNSKIINISINPTYLCNFRCRFCYLSLDQLKSKKTIDLEKLHFCLREIQAYKKIGHVDLYGGEILLLDQHYAQQMVDIIYKYTDQRINLITNLSMWNDYFLSGEFEISVSFDYFAREKFELVYKNMSLLGFEFSVLILASKEVVHMSDKQLDEFIGLLNSLSFLKSVEIKPFSRSSFNYHSYVPDEEFEEFVKRWILKREQFKFDFVNEIKLKAVCSKSLSAWSDDHLYINPDGRLVVLDFNDKNDEFFLELENVDSYIAWGEAEKARTFKNEACSQCSFLGHCLSEHLRPVHNSEASCNGYRNLINWYQHERL